MIKSLPYLFKISVCHRVFEFYSTLYTMSIGLYSIERSLVHTEYKDGDLEFPYTILLEFLLELPRRPLAFPLNPWPPVDNRLVSPIVAASPSADLSSFGQRKHCLNSSNSLLNVIISFQIRFI